MAQDKTKKDHRLHFILPLAGIIVLTTLPFFIFRPVSQEETSQKIQDRFTFMTQTSRMERDPHDLEYWEKAGNPELFAKPDSQFGYSAFLNPEMNYLKPLGSNEDHIPALPGVFSVGKITVRGERSPKELLSQVRFPLIDTTQKYQSLFIDAPAFLLEGGIILPVSGFVQPESAVKDLKPTLFKVSRTTPDSPPDISIEQSCGDANLDGAALQILFQRAAVNEKITGIVRVEWLNGGKK